MTVVRSSFVILMTEMVLRTLWTCKQYMWSGQLVGCSVAPASTDESSKQFLLWPYYAVRSFCRCSSLGALVLCRPNKNLIGILNELLNSGFTKIPNVGM